MEPTSTPAGGQPATPRAEASAQRSGAIRMSVHIPEGWNPHTELLQIADYARDLCKRSDDLLERAEQIEADLAEADEKDRWDERERWAAMAEIDSLRQRAAEGISRNAMREVNFRVCLLAMRLSGCRITIPAAEAEQEGGAL